MKNKFCNIFLLIFLFNSFSIFSLEDNVIKEVLPIESIYSDNIEENEALDSSKIEVEEDFFEETKNESNHEELKATNIISTNKDLKENPKENNVKEDKFEEISDKTNRVTALGSAMGAVDLSKTPLKKFRIGAGVGQSSNKQAVAVGIGYAPTEKFRVNTKISTSTTSSKSTGISIGASYDLDW